MDEWCGLLRCFDQLFGFSFWRHPFTAEDPFVSKWYNAKFLQICSDLEWSEGEYFQPIEIFGWTYFLIHFLYCTHVLWIVCDFMLLIFFSSDNKMMDMDNGLPVEISASTAL